MEVFILLATILFGGVAGVFLGRWMNRANPKITLVSIAKGQEVGATTELPDIVVELSKDFPFGVPSQPLNKFSHPDQVATLYKYCDEIIEGAPRMSAIISDVRRDLSRAQHRDEKEELLYKIVSSADLLSTVSGAIYHKQFAIAAAELRSTNHAQSSETSASSPDRSSDNEGATLPPKQSFEGAEEIVFDVHETPARGSAATLTIMFPHRTAELELEEADTFRKDALTTFLRALQKFDRGAISQCLDFAEQAFEKGRLKSHAIKAALDSVFEHDPFEIEAVAVNNGERVAVINPYGALVTEGGKKQIPPTSIRVIKIMDGGQEFPIPEEASTYVSLEPKSTKRLIFLSEKLDDNSQLRSAYESGILRCSVTLLQQRTHRKPKKICSPWKDFGADLKRQLASAAVTAVRS
jgi:hypothetical protein